MSCQNGHSATIDALLHDLPESQAGAGRHKCTACAYELGRTHGTLIAARAMMRAANALGQGALVPDTGSIEAVCAANVEHVTQRQRMADEAMGVGAALAKLTTYFNGDGDKARRWLQATNPLLGNVRPISLFELGQGRKVLAFIDTQLAENLTPPRASPQPCPCGRAWVDHGANECLDQGKPGDVWQVK